MKIPITFFAPAERKPVDVVLRQADYFRQVSITQTFLNATLNYLLVLNAQRQIVMASENFLELVPGKTMGQIIGLRPGEALGCIHAPECEGGCGTSQLCSQCGIVNVILLGLDGCQRMQECQLTRRVIDQEEILHLRALATPLLQNHDRYTLLAIENIGQEESQQDLSHSKPAG